MKHVLFDIESTGLLRQNSKIHCIILRDLENPKVTECYDTVQNNVDEGVERLQQAKELVGHNIASYDIPLLLELYPDFKEPAVSDTLIYSRIFFANLVDDDFRLQYVQKDLPKNLYGSHSLKAWGLRLGHLKGSFAESTDWATYSPEMRKYCEQDTLVNVYLYQHLLKKAKPFLS